MGGEAIYNIAEKITEKYPPTPLPPDDPAFEAIPDEAVEVLTEIIIYAVADLIQAYIDAGSERDVTHEDETLREGVKSAFNDWSVAEYHRQEREHPSHIQHHNQTGGAPSESAG